MLRILLSLAAVLCVITATGQSGRSLELSFIARYDRHVKDHVSVWPGALFNPATSLSGTSYGLNLGYRHGLRKNFSMFVGLGYYELGIDKIRRTTPPGSQPAVINTRPIENVDFADVIHHTDKYQYDNLALTVGINKAIPWKNNLYFDLGMEAVGYYCISQRYYVGEYHDPPSFLSHDSKPLMFGFNGTIGFLKEYNKFYIRPALYIPIYQRMGGDERFRESRSESISKWFNGIGATLKIGRYF
jgi:hypothetical protein